MPHRALFELSRRLKYSNLDITMNNPLFRLLASYNAVLQPETGFQGLNIGFEIPFYLLDLVI